MIVMNEANIVGEGLNELNQSFRVWFEIDSGLILLVVQIMDRKKSVSQKSSLEKLEPL